jgi:hypothetical protein
MDRDRFFGGHPAAVLVRLVLLSIVAGIVLSALDITPDNLFYHLNLLARRLYDMGFGVFEWLFKYFLIGAWSCSRSGSSCACCARLGAAPIIAGAKTGALTVALGSDPAGQTPFAGLRFLHRIP